MIHNIAPHRFHNEFRLQVPKPNDYLIHISDNKVLLKKNGNDYHIPQIQDFPDSDSHYLFSIDDLSYFLENQNKITVAPKGYEFVSNRVFRNLKNKLDMFGGATAFHIAHWESQNKFCGHCGCPMEFSTTERAKICPQCKNTVYPKISPVVIVAVHNGEELLMARNLDHPDKSRLFLISGFVEIGESLEQAVEREVMEETGLHIKNIKYFGSEPWPFSDSLIAGFNAELEGSKELHIQETEIETAMWVKRKDIPQYDTSVSISSCLIEAFRHNQ